MSYDSIESFNPSRKRPRLAGSTGPAAPGGLYEAFSIASALRRASFLVFSEIVEISRPQCPTCVMARVFGSALPPRPYHYLGALGVLVRSSRSPIPRSAAECRASPCIRPSSQSEPLAEIAPRCIRSTRLTIVAM